MTGAEEWDEPGLLSIVVQGAVFQGNLVETANHCRHWRALFPHAEIILAISVTDILADAEQQRGDGLRLIPRLADDGHLLMALEVIKESCDRVAFADAALPLPPIKIDSPKPNNMNFQINAARRGLELARGRHVLRIRSDMIFLDRSFLDQYRESAAVPRGRAALFEQRVMISSLFTLNPHTLERLPFHFSDWFHFGLRSDVTRLWDVPAVTLRDSVHYRTRPHAADSNAAERLFNTRLAVEQHLVYACFKPAFPDLTLDHHNDRRSMSLARDILVDNFAICDLARAHCLFEKYAFDIADYNKTFHCLTREDWFALAHARDVDPAVVLDRKIKEADDMSGSPQPGDLPRTYAAARLKIGAGRLVDGEIHATATDGVLFFGPYTTLDSGRYLASVHVTAMQGDGDVVLNVTWGEGKIVVAEKVLRITDGRGPPLEISFDIAVPRAPKLEVVCNYRGLRALAVSGVTIAERPAADVATPRWPALRSRARP